MLDPTHQLFPFRVIAYAWQAGTVPACLALGVGVSVGVRAGVGVSVGVGGGAGAGQANRRIYGQGQGHELGAGQCFEHEVPGAPSPTDA
jgi:hypothetical protein